MYFVKYWDVIGGVTDLNNKIIFGKEKKQQ